MTTAAIRLSFVTDTQDTVTVRVPRASLTVNTPLVNAVMNEIIRTDAYDTRGRGTLVSPLSAHLNLTTVHHFDVA